MLEEISAKFMQREYSARNFHAFFGLDVEIADSVWEMIRYCEDWLELIHLLWALYFLKINPTDDVNYFSKNGKNIHTARYGY